MKQLEEDPWAREIPDKFHPGDIVKGTVTKLTNFGVFVEIAHDLEGLLHISELSDEKVETPEDLVKPAQQLSVVVLRVDLDERKIGLSLKRVPPEYNPELQGGPSAEAKPDADAAQPAAEASEADAAEAPAAETSPETPAAEAPAEAVETPAAEAPAEAVETPAAETPAEPAETPADETPDSASETPTEPAADATDEKAPDA